MKKYCIVFLLILSISFVGCSNNTIPTQKSNLTVGMVKTQIEKSITTQSEIINTFGAPNIVTKNKANDEVWSYNKMASNSNASNVGWGLLVVGGQSAMSNTTTSSFDLIITFDENDIVKDYSMISSSY